MITLPCVNYYNGIISDSIKTKNIYPQQQYVMNFIANENKLKIENYFFLSAFLTNKTMIFK